MMLFLAHLRPLMVAYDMGKLLSKTELEKNNCGSFVYYNRSLSLLLHNMSA